MPNLYQTVVNNSNLFTDRTIVLLATTFISAFGITSTDLKNLNISPNSIAFYLPDLTVTFTPQGAVITAHVSPHVHIIQSWVLTTFPAFCMSLGPDTKHTWQKYIRDVLIHRRLSSHR